MACSNIIKSDLSLQLQQSEGEPFTMYESSCANKKQMSLPLAIMIALLIEGGLLASFVFFSDKPVVKTQEVQQITEFVPMELPSPPAPLTPPLTSPAPEPVPDLPPQPVKMEAPKPLEQAVIKQKPVEKKPEKKVVKKPEKKVVKKPEKKVVKEPEKKVVTKKEKKIEPHKTVPPENVPPVNSVPKQPKAPPVANTSTTGNSKAVSLSRTKPTYPRKALSMGLEGSVKLSFTVRASGEVTNVRVLKSKPPRIFDREAIAAVKSWKFKPRLDEGKAVDSTVTQVIEFKLSDQ